MREAICFPKGSKWTDRCVEIDTLSSAQIRELLEDQIIA
jgi:hypothetical protein